MEIEKISRKCTVKHTPICKFLGSDGCEKCSLYKSNVMFSGALMAMGKELGIPTPYNEYTYHIIKALEEKNDGLVDYSGQNKENTCAR